MPIDIIISLKPDAINLNSRPLVSFFHPLLKFINAEPNDSNIFPSPENRLETFNIAVDNLSITAVTLVTVLNIPTVNTAANTFPKSSFLTISNIFSRASLTASGIRITTSFIVGGNAFNISITRGGICLKKSIIDSMAFGPYSLIPSNIPLKHHLMISIKAFAGEAIPKTFFTAFNIISPRFQNALNTPEIPF